MDQDILLQLLQEIKNVGTGVGKIEPNIGILLDRMTAMETVVCGVNRDNGLVGGMKDLSDRLDKMETWRDENKKAIETIPDLDRWRWKVIGQAAGICGMVTLIITIIGLAVRFI